ncbi:MAG: hypothetical protein FD180_3342 [Planctomycetota bacterium]|nr:MAG: hypothetical protein FD180_3342 [Planctomycetota bacterium]
MRVVRRGHWKIVDSAETESSGPDYFTQLEWDVLHPRTGARVAHFTGSIDDTYLVGERPAGTRSVRISADGTQVIAEQAEGTFVRKPLPDPGPAVG